MWECSCSWYRWIVCNVCIHNVSISLTVTGDHDSNGFPIHHHTYTLIHTPDLLSFMRHHLFTAVWQCKFLTSAISSWLDCKHLRSTHLARAHTNTHTIISFARCRENPKFVPFRVLFCLVKHLAYATTDTHTPHTTQSSESQHLEMMSGCHSQVVKWCFIFVFFFHHFRRKLHSQRRVDFNFSSPFILLSLSLYLHQRPPSIFFLFFSSMFDLYCATSDWNKNENLFRWKGKIFGRTTKHVHRTQIALDSPKNKQTLAPSCCCSIVKFFFSVPFIWLNYSIYSSQKPKIQSNPSSLPSSSSLPPPLSTYTHTPNDKIFF